METALYSVRMRATLQGRHLAGAERLVAGSSAGSVAVALVQRAMNCTCGPADEIHCSLEQVDPDTVRCLRLPDLHTYRVEDWREGRRAARSLLVRAGVRDDIAAEALDLLGEGAAEGGGVMRGAVLMDALTGERLEADRSRGVRVSRMDLSAEFRPELARLLDAAGLAHHRVMEALVLAGKVLHAPGLVAELCWSDDPAYTTGYVAAPHGGYQRISALKPSGDPHGGRVFFVNRGTMPMAELVDYLERAPVLFNAVGRISPPVQWVDSDD